MLRGDVVTFFDRDGLAFLAGMVVVGRVAEEETMATYLCDEFGLDLVLSASGFEPVDVRIEPVSVGTAREVLGSTFVSRVRGEVAAREMARVLGREVPVSSETFRLEWEDRLVVGRMVDGDLAWSIVRHGRLRAAMERFFREKVVPDKDRISAVLAVRWDSADSVLGYLERALQDAYLDGMYGPCR